MKLRKISSESFGRSAIGRNLLRATCTTLLSVGALAIQHPAYANPITYTIDISANSFYHAPTGITGTITTDGTVGTLSAANILSDSLTFNGETFDNVSGNASRGTAFTATSSAIQWLTNNPDSFIQFGAKNGDFLMFSRWNLILVTCCGQWNWQTNVAVNNYNGGALTLSTSAVSDVSAVPLPPSSILFLFGLTGMAGFLSRRTGAFRSPAPHLQQACAIGV